MYDRGLVKGVAQSPDIAAEDIAVMFNTNVTGLITLTQEVMKIYKTRPNGGAGDIINIGSIAGRTGYPGGSIYCATKAAVSVFTDALRKELIATRIRVIEIDPGQVETEFSVVRFYGDKAKADKVYEGVDPLTPDDIAEVIVFAAGRRENVVIADTLIFPQHQVRSSQSIPHSCRALTSSIGERNANVQEDISEAPSMKTNSNQLHNRPPLGIVRTKSIPAPSLCICLVCSDRECSFTLRSRCQRSPPTPSPSRTPEPPPTSSSSRWHPA